MLDMMSKFGLSTAIKETISPFPLAWVNEIASTMVDACVPKADLPALEWKPRKVKMNNNLARKMKRKQEKQEAEAAAAAGCVTGGETTNKTGGNSNESASSPSAMDTDAQSQAETPTESPARETQSEKPSVEAGTEAETQKGRGKGKGKGKKKYTNTIDNDSNPALVNRKVNPLPASYVEPEKTELLPRQLTNDSTKQCLRNGSESLIIAVSWDAEKTLDALWPLLLPSGSFVVFSQYLAPLNKLHARLKNKKQAVFLQCSETWYRVQQVLPNRTHPMMNMDGGSGYILTGIKVDDTLDVRPMSARFVTHTGNKRRAKKRRRK